MSFIEWYDDLFRKPANPQARRVSVDAGWYQIALKHYCGICERWFGDIRGKLMHDRHRHKP